MNNHQGVSDARAPTPVSQVTCSHMLASLLAVSTMQIELALEEGNERMEELGRLFSRIATFVGQSAPASSFEASGAAADAESLGALVNQALIGLQFYDRLAQRLRHVSTSLGVMQPHLRELSGNAHTTICADILEEIRSQYSLEDEKLVFNSIVGGASYEEARRVRHPHSPGTTPCTELF